MGALAGGESPAADICWAGRSGTIKAVPRIAVVRAEVGRRKTRLLAGWGGRAGGHAGAPRRCVSIRFRCDALRRETVRSTRRSTFNETPMGPTFLAGPGIPRTAWVAGVESSRPRITPSTTPRPGSRRLDPSHPGRLECSNCFLIMPWTPCSGHYTGPRPDSLSLLKLE